jgi:hypothetical protein
VFGPTSQQSLSLMQGSAGNQAALAAMNEANAAEVSGAEAGGEGAASAGPLGRNGPGY